MRAKPIMSGVLALVVAAGSLLFAGCETLPDGGSTSQPSVVSTTSAASTTLPVTNTTEGAAAGHWEEGGVSLNWPAGWRSASLEEDMRWPLGRLLDCALLLGLEQGDSYPRVELVRLELPPGDALQSTFDEAYGCWRRNGGTHSAPSTAGPPWWTATALVKSYELPMGEPYYKHQDVWIEVEGSLFVLAGRDGVWTFDENVLPDFESSPRACASTPWTTSSRKYSGGGTWDRRRGFASVRRFRA